MTMAALAATVLLAGCGSAGTSLLGGMAGGTAASTPAASTNNATASGSESGGLASLIGNVLGTVLGASNKLTEADLEGTWNFQGVLPFYSVALKCGSE